MEKIIENAVIEFIEDGSYIQYCEQHDINPDKGYVFNNQKEIKNYIRSILMKKIGKYEGEPNDSVTIANIHHDLIEWSESFKRNNLISECTCMASPNAKQFYINIRPKVYASQIEITLNF
jgi:hypothetical protein